jgi:diadenosine tetraphosphate (Ap4A) HIT family hydrolase
MTGVACGGYLFSKSEPRSILEVASCKNRCYKPNEVAGLIMSAAILRAPFLIPNIVQESDTCLAIRHPIPWGRIHYVLFPKQDIRNITTLTSADTPYVLGCFAMIRDLVLRDKLDAYRVYTNGPGYQEVAYLHFHIIAK